VDWHSGGVDWIGIRALAGAGGVENEEASDRFGRPCCGRPFGDRAGRADVFKHSFGYHPLLALLGCTGQFQAALPLADNAGSRQHPIA
jgi:hypothetical protein